MKKILLLKLTNLIVIKLYVLTLIMAISFVSCKMGTGPNDRMDLPGGTDGSMGLKDKSKTLIVKNGTSIQSQVDAANAGTIIFIEPGTYMESVLVTKPGIRLIGLTKDEKGVIIQDPGQEENGISVTGTGDGFVLKNVTIQDFEGNGVLLTQVDNFVLDHVKSVNNKEYGLFPVLCNGGLIQFCSATGSSDTGIYVGQSSNITVKFNVAFANVSGFEIENCTHVTASFNESYGNAAGLLVFLLPGLTVKTATNNIITHNQIHDNNHVNFALPGGGFEVFIPSGSGILMVGADNTTVEHNSIRNNNFVGIATVSTLTLGALAGIPPAGMADIEPNPDGSEIEHNLVKDNGSVNPPGLPLPAADLLWDGSGTNNCWKANVFATSFPANLPVCD
jgi:parallel beta-helix repeat protein